jgi:ribonuclease HI
MVIYTDGSGIKGKIGAAAYSTTSDQGRHQHLGNDKQFNVYAGELAALQLATNMLHDRNLNNCRVYSDSQAAIKAINRPRTQSGQAIIKEILDSIDTVMRERP